MTQIIERVARGIFTFVYLWGEEQTDEGRAEAHAAWENLQEKPSLSSTDNKQKYRNYAQAALKEIKFDELVSELQRLSKAADRVGVAYFDTDTFSEEVLEMHDATQTSRSLLSELEKTE